MQYEIVCHGCQWNWTLGLKFNKSVVSCLKNSITNTAQTEGMFKSRSKSHTAVHTGCVLHPCFTHRRVPGVTGQWADDKETDVGQTIAPLFYQQKKSLLISMKIFTFHIFSSIKKKKDNAHRLFITFECIQIRLWTKGLHIRFIINFYEAGT